MAKGHTRSKPGAEYAGCGPTGEDHLSPISPRARVWPLGATSSGARWAAGSGAWRTAPVERHIASGTVTSLERGLEGDAILT